MKLTAVLPLLCVLTIASVRGHKEGDDSWKEDFRKEGVSEEDIARFVDEMEGVAALSRAAVEEEDYVSWDEARGYDECEHLVGENESPNSLDKPMSGEKACELAECPKYDKIESAGCGFGARNILAGKWAATDLDASDIEGSIMTAFIRLFKYMNGANDQGIQIGRTIPLIFKLYMDRNFEKTQACTIHIYIPAKLQDNPPLPTDEAVYIEEWIDTLVYHRTFGGDDVSVGRYMKEFGNLANALNKQDIYFYPYIVVTGAFSDHGGRARHEVMYLSW